MTPTPGPKTLMREDILHLCGDLPDWKIAKIEASGASYEDLTTAATWAQGQDDVTLPTHQPLTGLAAYLYEVLIADEDIWGEEHRA
ncbi:MAG: hypothetical protein ACLQF1_04645 [Methyloceanibacter sp.]|jgi:hypothetical protein